MEKECKYNHNPNDIDNSLRMLSRRKMTEPMLYQFICTECKKIFTFKRCANGSFEKFEE